MQGKHKLESQAYFPGELDAVSKTKGPCKPSNLGQRRPSHLCTHFPSLKQNHNAQEAVKLPLVDVKYYPPEERERVFREKIYQMILLKNSKYVPIGEPVYTCGKRFLRTQDRNDVLSKLKPKPKVIRYCRYNCRVDRLFLHYKWRGGQPSMIGLEDNKFSCQRSMWSHGIIILFLYQGQLEEKMECLELSENIFFLFSLPLPYQRGIV